MLIDILPIPHEHQRYDTTGDWFIKDGLLHIRPSSLSDDRHTFLLGLHELVEAVLCLKCGIIQDEVDEFDLAALDRNIEEPGDDPAAPYHRQHVIASIVERLAAELLGVDWNEYSAAVDTLKR
jgi:hypothetical protein